MEDEEVQGAAQTPIANVSNPYSEDNPLDIPTIKQARDIWYDRNHPSIDDFDSATIREGFKDNTTHSGGQDFTGLGINPTPDMDFNELQAYDQGTLEKIGKGGTRLVGETLINVAEIPGSLVGGAMALATWDIDKMTNNWWVNTADSLKEDLKEALPIYQTKAVQEGNVFKKMTSAAWWADEGTSGAAFMLSAFAPGLASVQLSKLFSLSSALSKTHRTSEVLRKVDKAFEGIGLTSVGKGAELGTATKRGLDVINMTTANTIWEASVEARSTQKQFLDEAERAFNAGEIDEKKYEELKAASSVSARNTFLSNVYILAGPNIIMSKMILGPTGGGVNFYKNLKYDAGIEGFAETAAKEATGKGAWKALKGFANKEVPKRIAKGTGRFTMNTFREGVWEEGAQSTVGDYYGKGTIEESITGTRKKNMLETYSDVLMSPDGQAAALLAGVLTGAVSLYSNKDNKKIKQSRQDAAKNILNFSANNYKVNFITASKGGFYKTDKNGNFINEKGEKVTDPIIDNEKLSDLGEAQSWLEEMHNGAKKLREEGNFRDAKILEAQSQSVPLHAFILAGGEGAGLLRDYLETAPAVDIMLEDINKERVKELTKEDYITKELERLEKLQEVSRLFEVHVSIPGIKKEIRDRKITNEEDKLALTIAKKQFYDWKGGQLLATSAGIFQLEGDLKELEEQKKILEQSTKSTKKHELESLEYEIEGTKIYIAQFEANNEYGISQRAINDDWHDYLSDKLEQEERNSKEVTDAAQEVTDGIKSAKTVEEVDKVTKATAKKGIDVNEGKKDSDEKEPISVDDRKRTNRNKLRTAYAAEYEKNNALSKEARKELLEADIEANNASELPAAREGRGYALIIGNDVDLLDLIDNKESKTIAADFITKLIPILASPMEIEVISPKSKAPVVETINKGINVVLQEMISDKKVSLKKAEIDRLNELADKEKARVNAIELTSGFIKEGDLVDLVEEGKRKSVEVISLYDTPETGGNALINNQGNLQIVKLSLIESKANSTETPSEHNDTKDSKVALKEQDKKEEEAQGDYKTVKVNITESIKKYSEQPRDKSKDIIEFQFMPSHVAGLIVAAKKEGNKTKEKRYITLQAIMLKIEQDGPSFLFEPKSRDKAKMFYDYMPLNIIARAPGKYSNGAAHITSKENESGNWSALEGEFREKIIFNWAANGGKLKGNEGQKPNIMVGVTGRWNFQTRGAFNNTAGAKNNIVETLGDISFDIFTPTGKGSQLLNKAGERVQGNFLTKGHEGRMFLQVKDNRGDDFFAALNNREFRDKGASKELSLLMRVLQDLISIESPKGFKDKLSKLSQNALNKVEGFYSNREASSLTYEEVLNSLIISGRSTDDTYVKVNRAAKTVTIGKQQYTAATFKTNLSGIKKTLGFKHQNVAVKGKNKLTTADKDYFNYIMSKGILTTDINKEGQVFTGDTSLYIGPNEVTTPNKQMESKKETPKGNNSDGRYDTAIAKGLTPKMANAVIRNKLIDINSIDKLTVAFLNEQSPNAVRKSKEGEALMKAIKGYVKEDIKACK